ncbi:MAG TPA: DUF4062 domain-containing protein [Pyrinomonadaceae bacterium]|nr:DUF4062 domain-containing protein [Pyrinomonadaceae bacterium]
MLFTVCHSVILLTFAVTVVFAGIKVSELRNTSANYNARLFTFGYFSLGAWILWILQYAILAGPFLSFPTSLPVDVLSLALIQNAFWASAILSLHLKQFSRKSLTLPLLAIFSVATILVAYPTRLLTSQQLTQFVAPFEGISTAVIFIVLGISIVQLRLSKVSAAIFLIHGFTQWLWTWRWLPLFSTTPIVHLAFPLWRVALLIAWFRLISEMRQRVQPSEQKFAALSDRNPGNSTERTELSNLLIPLTVMISSTSDDLIEEREAADIAIRELQLTRFRAETFGSVPHPPKVVCALLAEQCDIFVLIIGERYGYIMSDGISVVEFEYSVARKENREKILVYVKKGVDREPLLDEFRRRVEDFESGYFRSSFKAAADLRPKIQGDIVRWLAYRPK